LLFPLTGLQIKGGDRTSNGESKKEEKKNYKAIITARAGQSQGLRQTAFEAEVPEDKSLRQKVALSEEKKKRMTGQG
jgi:hypothetical protein